jgi:hypothetical protein
MTVLPNCTEYEEIISQKIFKHTHIQSATLASFYKTGEQLAAVKSILSFIAICMTK